MYFDTTQLGSGGMPGWPLSLHMALPLYIHNNTKILIFMVMFTFILNTLLMKSKAMDGSQSLCVKTNSSYLRTSGYV